MKLFTPSEFTRTQSKAFWLTSLWKVMRQQQKQYSVVFPCNLWPRLSFRWLWCATGAILYFQKPSSAISLHQPKFSLLKSLAKALKLPSERQKNNLWQVCGDTSRLDSEVYRVAGVDGSREAFRPLMRALWRRHLGCAHLRHPSCFFYTSSQLFPSKPKAEYPSSILCTYRDRGSCFQKHTVLRLCLLPKPYHQCCYSYPTLRIFPPLEVL